MRSTPVEFRLRGRLVRLSWTTNILEVLDFVARREASVIVRSPRARLAPSHIGTSPQFSNGGMAGGDDPCRRCDRSHSLEKGSKTCARVNCFSTGREAIRSASWAGDKTPATGAAKATGHRVTP